MKSGSDLVERYRRIKEDCIVQRVLFLVKFYFTIVALSALYKFAFILFDSGETSCSVADSLAVILHGLPHDFAIAGYFTVLPLLLTTVTIFRNFPMKRFFSAYNSIIAFVIGLTFLSDITLYPYWEFKLDASVLIYLDSPANAFASVTIWHLLLLLAVMAALTYGIYRILSLTRRQEFHNCEKKHYKASVLFLILGGFLFLGIRGGITESTNNVGTVYYSDKQFLNDAAVNPIFSFLYTVINLEDLSEEYSFLDEKERFELMQEMYVQDNLINDTLLCNSRPNIITIVLEGMSANLIEGMDGMKGVTPNFDRISEEGILFTQCYANSYRTDRGLICALSGFPSFPKTSVMKNAKRSQSLPSLAKSLKEAGYKNTFIYGGDVNFTNMKGYFYSTGYGRVISDQDFTAAERETHQWGAGDDVTFRKLYDVIMEQEEEPWHITYLTLSSHEPWTVPYNRIPDDQKANSFAFTDEEFGKFIDRFKGSKEWDNTLIICIADHSVVRYPEGIQQTDKGRNRIPLLLLGGAITEPRHIDILCNQSDLPATILSQLQLPIEEFIFSRNILGPGYTYPSAYHSYNNGISLIDSAGFTVYDLNSQSIIHNEPGKGGEERIKRAKAILQTSYQDFISK